MQAVGEPWVAALETAEYGALPLATRLAMLGALVQLALEGPSARAALEARLEEAARVRKAMAEDAKVRLFAGMQESQCQLCTANSRLPGGGRQRLQGHGGGRQGALLQHSALALAQHAGINVSAVSRPE